MTQIVDEERSWLEPAITGDELRRLLEAVKAALEEHNGPLCSSDLQSLVEAERASSPDDFAPLDESAAIDAADEMRAAYGR